MGKGRLEAFSDGVLAIIITIMVLELKFEDPKKHEPNLSALAGLWPVFLSYVLSYIYVGIYWNNHHHLIKAAQGVNGAIMWANLHLLFWLSLVPFSTHWMGDTHFAPAPTAIYGVVLLLCGIAYTILVKAIKCERKEGSLLAAAIGRDRKGKLSLLIYAVAIGVAFVQPWIAGALYGTAALIWLIPDRRIARALKEQGEPSE
ncbi:MAG TPA: TMEM175 family protein [Verrucomicrobiales bacterium]|nr:TMEM175 family protein [Verrucomicrobiales bacterium]